MIKTQVKVWARGMLAMAAATAVVQAGMAQAPTGAAGIGQQRPGYGYAAAPPFAPSSTLQKMSLHG